MVSRGISLIAGLFLILIGAGSGHGAELRVAVTADFVEPMQRIAEQFRKASGHTLSLRSGATGKLAAEIRKSGGYDVLLAADEATPKQLLQEGLAQPGTRIVYATGRLLLWSAQPGVVDKAGSILNQGNFSTLAMPDPRLSPYGVAVREALTRLTMWNSIQRKLDKREDEQQAYQLAAAERVDLAFIPLSLVMKNGKIASGSGWLVPAEMHAPLRQSAVLLTAAKEQEAARALLNFLQGPQAAAVMRAYGYESP